jgi:hypothetical protein
VFIVLIIYLCEIFLQVESVVTKVPKIPLEVRMMLTYPEGYEKLSQQNDAQNDSWNDTTNSMR